MIRLMKRILEASGPYKRRIQTAFIFSFLKSLLAKAPVGLAFLVLSAFYYGTMDERLCLWSGAAMLLCLLLQVLFQNLSDRLQSAAGFMMFADKRMQLGNHLRNMPMGYFTEGNIGKISSVLSTDMVFVEENCMTMLADMMSYLFAQAIMMLFLLALDWRLGLAAVGILLLVVLIADGMNQENLKDSVIRQEQSENLTKAVLDFIEGIGIIKTYNLLGEKSKELSDNFRESCRTSIHFEEAVCPWQRKLNTLYGIGAVMIIGFSVYLMNIGSLEVTHFIGIMLFVFELYGPVRALYMQSARLTVMDSCMDRMEAVFAERQLPNEGRSAIPTAYEGPAVAFQNVSFAYHTGGMAGTDGKIDTGGMAGSGRETDSAGNGDQREEKEVLRSISFTINQGQMTALVGPSGGGKSTIASLLTRFWDVKKGQVLVKGVDIRDVPLADLMDQISMVFQRVYLFQDTIYNNISMGRQEASREEVIEAAKKARCYDFIMSLPDGFDTVIGEGGATLSGGEKQRISIARCILKDAPIVILDEATASVDADNESYIQEAISELCRGKTLLVIAHRLNTIRHADQILVIADGRIVQKGTHDQLMEQDGIYRNFVIVRENESGWNRN
ncbi:MAG: ABC transporter ATP-binding protein [Lachnospiraceae bacterium]|nr:ABC transporter ATP-binding protein [Lachnospiraceae bacterium]